MWASSLIANTLPESHWVNEQRRHVMQNLRPMFVFLQERYFVGSIERSNESSGFALAAATAWPPFIEHEASFGRTQTHDGAYTIAGQEKGTRNWAPASRCCCSPRS